VSLIAKLTCVFVLTGLASFGSTVSFSGPTTETGIPCSASDPQCVIGGLAYAIFGAQLTEPSGASNLWTLTIETNYPALILGNMIPPAQWGVDLLNYSIADFMIHWAGNDYAIVLAQHIKGSNPADGYVAGNLYQAPNVSPDFVPSGTNTTLFGTTGILPDSPRPNFPIWLAPGGTLLGTGTVTVANTGSGTPAQYTITDTFTAFPGFLSTGDFDISMASWACANGIIVGGGGSFVPEPGTMILIPSFALLSLLMRSLRARLGISKRWIATIGSKF
jgi:hypothetical protein